MALNQADSFPASPPAKPDPLLRNIGLLSGGLLVTWTLTTVWTLFVPRMLGPHGMGLIVMAWSTAGIFTAVGGLGVRGLLTREISRAPARAPRLVGTALLLRAMSVGPCVALAVVYVRLGHFTGEHAVVLYLAIGIAFVAALLEPLQAAFQAIEHMQYLAYGDVLNKTILTVCGIGLVLMGFGATAQVLLTFGALAAVLALSMGWRRRHFTIDWTGDLGAAHKLLLDALPYWSFGLFYTIYLWIDAAILAVMTSATVVGWYGVPTKLFGSMMFVPVILCTAWLPRLVASFNEGPAGLKRMARTPIELVMILGLPVAVGAALVAGPLIYLLYGPAYLPAVPVFAILALTSIPMYFNILVSQVLISSNRQPVWTKALALACLINPAFNIILIRAFQDRYHNGAIGAATSMMLTELVLAAVGVWVIHPYLHRASIVRVGRAVVATIGMAGIVWLASPLGLIAELVAGTISFVGLAVLVRAVSVAELEEVLRLVRRSLRAMRFSG